LARSSAAADAVGVLVDDVLRGLDPDDPVLASDLDRLAVVRGRRTATAQAYFAGMADRWDEERSLHAPDATVEAAIVDLIDPVPYDSLLDLGTGTGRMLQLLADPGRRPVERAV